MILSMNNRLVPWLAAIFVVLAGAGCTQNQSTAAEQPKGQAAPLVEIQRVEAGPWAESFELPGRMAPVRQAVIQTRAAGIVLSRHFEEGSDVAKGQLLFQIDPAPYEAVLARAQASLATARASLFQAESEIRRDKPLIKIGAVSPQKYDADLAALKLAKASEMAALADIKTARINLGYTRVTAPISGRIGRALVSEGALVGQGEATQMALIQQLDPIYADFTQPVAEFLKMKQALDGRDARVEIFLKEIGYKASGRFLFSDVTVDRSTGQVSLRSEFPNPGATLMPNMFVRIRTTLPEVADAVFIPQRAVRFGADGTASVMVVDSQGRVQVRPVTLGRMDNAQWQVCQGLEPGEFIVATGAGKVRPGMDLASQMPAADKMAQN